MLARVRYIGGKNNWGLVQNVIYDVSDVDPGEYGSKREYWIVLNKGIKAEGMAFMKSDGEVVHDYPLNLIPDELFEV